MSNTRVSTIDRLVVLEIKATGALFDRLNASANQPAAYPVMARAANVVEEIITVAIDRIASVLMPKTFAIGFVDKGGGYLAAELSENNGYGGSERSTFLSLEEAKAAAQKFCTGRWGCCTPAVQEIGSAGQWEKPYDQWVWSEHTPTLLFARYPELR